MDQFVPYVNLLSSIVKLILNVAAFFVKIGSLSK